MFNRKTQISFRIIKESILLLQQIIRFKCLGRSAQKLNMITGCNYKAKKKASPQARLLAQDRWLKREHQRRIAIL